MKSGERIDEHSEVFNKELEINRRLGGKEGWIGDLEDKVMGITQSEQ